MSQTVVLLPAKDRPNASEYSWTVDVGRAFALRFDLDVVAVATGNCGCNVEFWDPAKQAWAMVYLFTQQAPGVHAVYHIDRRMPFLNFNTYNVIPEKLMRARFAGPGAGGFTASLSCTLGD